MHKIDKVAHGLTYDGLTRWWAEQCGAPGLIAHPGGMWENEECTLMAAEDAWPLMSDDMAADVWHTQNAVNSWANLTADLDGSDAQVESVTVAVPGHVEVTFDGHYATIRAEGAETIIEDELGVGTYLIEQVRDRLYGDEPIPGPVCEVCGDPLDDDQKTLSLGQANVLLCEADLADHEAGQRERADEDLAWKQGCGR